MTSPQDIYSDYKVKVDALITSSVSKDNPATLYEPIKYILSNGGKRIRPMMIIFACEICGGKMEDALNASVAIEMLHNFTLVHDDIMDNADTRRGNETIHKKWNDNVAILTGDHLIGLAYSYLIKTDSKNLKGIVDTFTEGIIEVCEGQSYDKEYEDKSAVTIDEYLMMISKKTAKMLETSAIVGALLGNGTPEQIGNIRNYASNIGLAFQIQDDLLDITADETEFGKKIGGDLVEGKKTYLLLKAMELVSEEKDKLKIMEVVNKEIIKHDVEERILTIKRIYEDYGIIESAQERIRHYTELADKYLNTFPDSEYKERLKWFSEMLMGRSF
ncbi:MAG: polyprenyl synthetase family protein [Ignavibacteria bacterium]|jgi:geranylgeranyl diphosphate synthase type II|nr:polyprenyl synthetase family protein [Ignavibacteria bacterium]